METKVQILKEKERKLEKELKDKLREVEKLKKFIQNEEKEKEKNFEVFLDKINEVKERIIKEVMRKKYEQQIIEQKIMRNLLKEGTIHEGFILGDIAFCEPKHKDTGCLL